MKKFSVLLTSISLTTVVSANVIACLPQPKDDGNNAIGDKLDLSLFAFDKIGNKFNLKKDNVIENNQVDLKTGITKGIQDLASIYLPWNEVDVTVSAITPKPTFKQVYVKMQAKDGAKSIKGSVVWGNAEAKPPTYVDLRPSLKDWQPEGQQTLTVSAEGELEAAAFTALGGAALGKTTLTELGLRGKYDQASNSYTVSADGTTSDFFATSDFIFNAVIK
ncbi:MAG: hypothetical protein EIB84_04355 [Spiroplasma poulsonii]|uniref:Lipoprotein n=1 Tax=Spiroplasma poulsonii TaxID=2138 RepID=A0A2P6FEQ8_9MOLU|nr:hypothetical protein [Spiroplasma poulsonii]KAF0850304.1 hypothetical protein MSROBK_018570 [Spiroplasma poulsonii]MBW1242065.1 hypothetical protein [Spiroplasma poulsonii]PQM31951.1 hypothetical protein SMSRO_SF018190 [Spiroplasma poulsonii]PWF94420.1 hypothetical protein SMH99_24040 [Spiroplasma poulsonii]PWF96989.1 hypothetical protein SMSE_24360 [Spiroplasma poulsonii]